MGYFTTNDDIFQLGLTPYQYAVFSYLLRCANAKGECWPSIRKMAKLLRMHRDTVRAAVHVLQEKGLIAVTRRHTESGDHDSHLYTIIYKPHRGGGLNEGPPGLNEDPPGLNEGPGWPKLRPTGGLNQGHEGLPNRRTTQGRTYNSTPPGKKFKEYDEETKRLIRSLYVT